MSGQLQNSEGHDEAGPVSVRTGGNISRRETSQRIVSALGQIVTILMRSPAHQHLTLTDLKRRVVPAVLAGQFSLAGKRFKQDGLVVPVGALVWARVSPDVDKRLSADTTLPIDLTSEEWTSGDNIWVVDAVGEPALITEMLRRLSEREWRGRVARLRTRTADGSVHVHTLATAA